jgi:hypothetical protein
MQVLVSRWFWTIFLQWLWEEEEGFHRALPAKLIKECLSKGVEQIYLYVSLWGAEPLLCYLCTACVNSSVDTVVMLVSSIVIIISTLCCGHDECYIMIVSVWCVFSKLLRPSWISKYIVKTESNSTTIGCMGHWLFSHHRHYLSDVAAVNSVSLPNCLVTRHRLKDHHGQIILQCDGDDALWLGGSFVQATVMFASTQAGRAPMRWKQGHDHRWIISQHGSVSVHLHRRVGPQCDGMRIWSRTDHKPCGGVSAYP